MRSKHRKPGRPWAPLFVAAGLSLAAQPTFSQDSLTLALPIDCTLGERCYIQQYVDRDPGPTVSDFSCGLLANDGHRGTDFAVPTDADMMRGVRVIASAAGTVRATRDGMPDVRQGTAGATDVSGRECGNGVLITHEGGWETQYCHLMRGTVRVRNGQEVARGEFLGLVGMSGSASFPHVHFGVRRDGAVVDPFLPDGEAACDTDSTQLWETPLAYNAGGLIDAGLLDRVPEFESVKSGLPEDGLPAAPGAVVAWAHVANGRAGDVILFDLTGPEGPFGRHEEVLERNQPFLFRAYGRRAPPGGLPQGEWRATVIHLRDGTEIGRMTPVATIP